jgi:hypothetical protein
MAPRPVPRVYNIFFCQFSGAICDWLLVINYGDKLLVIRDKRGLFL